MPRGDAPEIGRDVLDPRDPAPRWSWLPARRAALGLSASAAPSLMFILVGLGLGPAALGVLPAEALTRLDPVVSVALATLGVFIGLGLGAMRAPGTAAVLLAASVEMALTMVVVTGAMYVLLSRWAVPLPVDAALFSAILGVCSSASAAMRVTERAAPDVRSAARIADMDDVPLVVLATFAVTAVAARPIGEATLLTVAAAIAAGTAGWLLFERARGAPERSVFVTGAVLLLGGIGAYLGSSPLLSGCVAGLIWVRTPGAADRIIGADLRRLQHPLVALLLIVAGASIQWTLALLWISAPLVLLRLTGKLLASAAAAWMTGVPAGLLATILVPPGVIGVAVALNVQQVLDSPNTLLLSGVTVAAGVSELLSALLPGEREDSC